MMYTNTAVPFYTISLIVCLRYFKNKQKTNYSKVQVPSTDKVPACNTNKINDRKHRITYFVSS